MKTKFLLGVIGAGNMATAIVKGALKTLKASDIIVSDRDSEKLQEMKNNGVCTTSDNTEVSLNCKYLLFAVKPQVAPLVFDEIKGKINAETVISIMAGISVDTLRKSLGDEFGFVRVMPNTPAMIQKGMSALSFSEKVTDKEFVINLFNSLGKTVVLSESDFDAVTSVSGSGPAYVYSFIKAMIDGGMDGGLDFETAKTLTLQTIVGACGMVENSNDDIQTLIDKVCSKGGTTIEAVNSFIADDLNGIIRKGIAKCKARSEELSNAK